MTDSLHLALPLIAAAQAQKHVTHNEALRSLDALVMLSLDDRDLTAPPGTPAEGARYLVKATGTGAFAGKDGKVAHFRDGAWSFHTPRAGWIAYVIDEAALVVFDGAAWTAMFGPAAEFQNVALFGLATTADAANPLSAVLNNALFAARTAAGGGDGSLRWKLSKENAGGVASLLLQDNFSGRAEIGLVGDDDLHIKVSADGSSWIEALRIARASGKVSFPAQGAREVLTASRTYYVRTDGSDSHDGLANTSGGAFLTLQAAIDAVTGLDLNGYDVTIQIADGTYNAGVAVAGPFTGGGTVTIQGNASTPANVAISCTSQHCFQADDGTVIAVKDMQLATATAGSCLRASRGARIRFQNIRFGAAADSHILALQGGVIEAAGNYAIAGGAASHLHAYHGGVITTSAITVTLSGTPAFSAYFVGVAGPGHVQAIGVTYSGAATGKRFLVHNNGFIDLGNSGASATYFPGDVAGETFRYGVYDYTTPGPLTLGGKLTVSDNTAASSTTTGSGIFGGGIGVAGAGYFGGGMVAAGNAAFGGAALVNAMQWATAADRLIRSTDTGSAARIDATNAARNAFQPLILSGSTLDLNAGGTQNLQCTTSRMTMALPIKLKSYTVASLPSGQAGDCAWASDLRVFNGAGTQEGAGAGTGGLVISNGTNWKIAGTNVTAVA